MDNKSKNNENLEPVWMTQDKFLTWDNWVKQNHGSTGKKLKDIEGKKHCLLKPGFSWYR